MKKSIIISFFVLLVITFVTWFSYTKFIKHTLNEVQKTILKQYDSIEKHTNVPKPVINNDCAFNLDSQTDDFLKNISEFSDYTWNNETKTATIILEDKSILKIERGGCNEFRLYGTIYLTKSDFKVTNKPEIYEKALWIASKIMEKPDYDFFLYALNTGNFTIDSYENQFLITLISEKFCHAELLFIRNPDNGNVEIKIGSTQCEKNEN